MKEHIKNIFAVAVGVIIWPIFVFGSPFTFIWLIAKDAEQYHSFGIWVLLIMLDSVVAITWPLYWLGRLISYLAQ